eukprot:COSAG02_NODE_66682_length_254_cov_17.625806_1_plen_22_part_10
MPSGVSEGDVFEVDVGEYRVMD